MRDFRMERMKVSVMSIAYRRRIDAGEKDIVDFVSFCHSHGVQALEITDCDQVGKEADLDNALASMGIEVASFNVTINPQGSVVPDDFKQGLDRVKDLQARSIMLMMRLPDTVAPLEETKCTLAQAFRTCAEYAGRSGIPVTFENRGPTKRPSPFVKLNDCLDILDQAGSDNLGFTFDTGNFYADAEDVVDTLRRALPRVRHFHLKDKAAPPSVDSCPDVPLGSGVIDFPVLIAILREGGYRGCLSIECSPPIDRDEDICQSIEYALNIAGEDLS